MARRRMLLKAKPIGQKHGMPILTMQQRFDVRGRLLLAIPKEMGVRVCDAAVEVLIETNNPAVMWGDTRLLHQIAARAKLKTAGRASGTERAVLDALSKQPGILFKHHTTLPNGRTVRVFRMSTKHDRPEVR